MAFLFVGCVLALVLEPAQATFWANRNHNTTLDFIFKWLTRIAEWPVVVFAILLAFFNHWRTGIWVGLLYGIEALTVATIKVYLNAPRPRMEIGMPGLHEVDGEAIRSYFSFPSGHTAAAFMGFGFIALLSANRRIQVLCATMAALIAYSRLYLGQHYLRDLIAGETIALLILLAFAWTHPKIMHWQWRQHEQ
jgi:membrane-associated phospholipid phosphatase